MFEHGELDALAQQAKLKLKEQQERKNEKESDASDENIYEEMLKDYEETAGANYVEPQLYKEEDQGEDEEEGCYDEDIYSELRNEPVGGENEPLPRLDEYDIALFPGGPTKLDIQSWKKEWEGYDIYLVEIINQTFVFRTLNRYEYKQLVTLQNADALQREEVICQTVTLWPENYTWQEMATTLAGIPSTLAEIVMEKSGFTKDYAIQVI